ncbi:MAG: hypothetical protein ACT4OY_08595 [Alphaproteobacteria bacterium]
MNLLEMLPGIEHEVLGRTLVLHDTIRSGMKINWNGMLIANQGAEPNVSISGPESCILYGHVDERFDFFGNGEFTVHGDLGDLPFVETIKNINLKGRNVGRGGYFYSGTGAIKSDAYLGEGCNLFSPASEIIHVKEYHDTVTFNSRKLSTSIAFREVAGQ